MWTTLSVRICLLTLAVMTLFSASVVSSSQLIPCCSNFSSRKIHIIKQCYEQKPRKDCEHAYLIQNKKGKWCIKPDAAWLKERIDSGKLHCPPDLSF